MNRVTIEELIESFELKPHPEGGYFAESYRSKESIRVHRSPFDLEVIDLFRLQSTTSFRVVKNLAFIV